MFKRKTKREKKDPVVYIYIYGRKVVYIREKCIYRCDKKRRVKKIT